MQIILRNIQYHPNTDNAALYMEPAGGSDGPLKPFFLPTTQAALTARAGGAVWSDADALAEAQHLLDVQFPTYGFTAVLP